ncbi:MAG: ZIP family metal transporter [Brevinematales bacterium]|nr:ZIP family metal transporter [Brevinematales bacterium]
MNTTALSEINPSLLVIIGVLFTWMLNNLGSLGIFIFNTPNRKVLDFLLGFSAGVMLAASIWSLLVPSMNISEFLNIPGWILAGGAFIMGTLAIKLLDTLIPHLHIDSTKVEGISTNFKKPILLYLAMTLHHIPEGFAVGIALGAMELLPNYSGIPVAIGIGIQNIPEGLALSGALLAYGVGKLKSFLYGVMSGFSEIIGGIIGFLVIAAIPHFLPISLAFAAGAMFYIVIEEVIPESQMSGNTDISTAGVIIGFVLMMTLDNVII